MEDLLDATLNELLRYRRASVSATQEFRTRKHNDDLCPRFAGQLCEYLEGSQRYHNVVYDVQGLRDRGKDVVLRFGEDEEDSTFVTFQIKSFDDLNDKSYLKTVKSQAFEVREDYQSGLRHHFMILCTNLAEHQDQVRNICAEFAKSEWATVIEPQYALTFLHLSSNRIDAIVQSVLRQDDAVHKAARAQIADFTPLEVAVHLCLLNLALDAGSYMTDWQSLRSIGFLEDVLVYAPDVPREDYFYEPPDEEDDDDEELPPDRRQRDRHRGWDERIGEALEALDEGPIHLDTSDELIHINPSHSVALEALILDAQARYGLVGSELLQFVFDALDVPRTFDLDVDLLEA